MEADKIVSIVFFILAVAVFVWGLYQRVKGNAAASASAFIAQVESTGLVGPEKMELVVNWLYDMIPVPFRKILTKEALQGIAQTIFDYMKRYTLAYIDTHEGKEEAYESVNNDLASDVASTLSGLSSVGLKALALNLNIEIEGKTDADLVKAIAAVVIQKAE